MGIYVNPTDCTKEEWLAKNATPTTLAKIKAHDYKSDRLPVVLMDNRAWTAAGVADSPEELDAFTQPYDVRPRTYYVADREKLADVVGDAYRNSVLLAGKVA